MLFGHNPPLVDRTDHPRVVRELLEPSASLFETAVRTTNQLSYRRELSREADGKKSLGRSGSCQRETEAKEG